MDQAARIVGKLKAAGDATEIPWSSVSQHESTAMATELMRCEVQISGNAKTTTCHANLHEKLPKKVENAKSWPTCRRQRTTPITRPTSSSAKGSFALLSGAPGNLVQNSQAKATKYCRGLQS